MASQDFFSKYWLVGVIVLLLGLNALWMFRLSGEMTPAVEGREAPVFELPGLPREGQTATPVSLAELRGRVVVLDFWASWCGPCLESMPTLATLDRRLRGKGLSVVGVLTGDADLAGAARVAEDAGVGYPLVVDPDGAVATRYGADNLPTVVVLDRQGVIRAVEVGLTPPGALARLVEPLLRP